MSDQTDDVIGDNDIGEVAQCAHAQVELAIAGMSKRNNLGITVNHWHARTTTALLDSTLAFWQAQRLLEGEVAEVVGALRRRTS